MKRQRSVVAMASSNRHSSSGRYLFETLTCIDKEVLGRFAAAFDGDDPKGLNGLELIGIECHRIFHESAVG